LFTSSFHSPAYWGIIDLTKESLSGCEEITESDLQKLSQDFSNKIKWKCNPAPKHFQDYFDDNWLNNFQREHVGCNGFDGDEEDLRKFDTYVKFM